MKYGNAIQSLKWVIQSDSYEERERLLIQWYKNHVREFQITNWSDSSTQENKHFAKYEEEKMFLQLMHGIIEKAEKTREAMGNQYVDKLKLILLVDE